MKPTQQAIEAAARALEEAFHEHADTPEGSMAIAEKILSADLGDMVLMPKEAEAREREILEAAIDRMGWPEIRAFKEELRRGQDVFEDAGGFMMRAIRRIFGLPSPYSEVVTYQQAARAMVAAAQGEQE